MSRLDQQALRRRTHLAQAVLAVIVVVGAAVVGQSIVSGPVFSSPYHVIVDLPEAAGLHERSDVAYRGQHIGLVSKVQLTGRGVRATLRIDDGVKIPRDSQFVVANLSAVGEQYLDVRPRTAQGPFLADGAVVAADDAVLPLPTWQLLADTQHVLRRIDVADIRTISREVSEVFGHGDVGLPDLVEQISRTMDLAEQLSPQVFSLLGDSARPLQTMADLSPQVRQFVANARTIAAALREANPAIGQLIDQGAVVVPVVADQFHQMSPVLVSLLESGTPVAQMARAHLPGLQHWYVWTPRQLEAMATATRNGSGHVVLVITPAKNCHYGTDVSPYQRDVALPLSAQCTTVAPDVQQRGAQNVPRP